MKYAKIIILKSLIVHCGGLREINYAIFYHLDT